MKRAVIARRAAARRSNPNHGGKRGRSRVTAPTAVAQVDPYGYAAAASACSACFARSARSARMMMPDEFPGSMRIDCTEIEVGQLR